MQKSKDKDTDTDKKQRLIAGQWRQFMNKNSKVKKALINLEYDLK